MYITRHFFDIPFADGIDTSLKLVSVDDVIGKGKIFSVRLPLYPSPNDDLVIDESADECGSGGEAIRRCPVPFKNWR